MTSFSRRSPTPVNIESLDTREALREDFAPLLAHYHYPDLDVAVVRSHDRRITRYISQWTYEQLDDDQMPLYGGIRYLSRLNSEWECWAVFDYVALEELQRKPILANDPDYRKVARQYRLTPY